MKLLTHNMLTSKIIKGVTSGFPLGITVTEMEVKEVDFNPAFVVKTLTKIDWGALRQAATQVGHGDGLPETLAEADTLKEDVELLKKIHNAMLQVEIIKGALVCPETGREFPISNGIPNMLLLEHEIQ